MRMRQSEDVARVLLLTRSEAKNRWVVILLSALVYPYMTIFYASRCIRASIDRTLWQAIVLLEDDGRREEVYRE